MKIFTLVLSLAVATLLRAQDLPPPPEGFSWQAMPELKSAILKPDAWFVKHESKGDTLAYFVSKEKIRGGAGFTTGISFECVRKIDRKAGVSPSVYIAKYADAAATKYSLTERRSFRQGPFDAVRFRYRPGYRALVELVYYPRAVCEPFFADRRCREYFLYRTQSEERPELPRIQGRMRKISNHHQSQRPWLSRSVLPPSPRLRRTGSHSSRQP